jgi:SAND domain
VQLGPPYLRHCAELQVLAAQPLVPAIQLVLFAPSAPQPPPAVRIAKRGREAAAVAVLAPTSSGGGAGAAVATASGCGDPAAGAEELEADLVPADLRLEVVCNDMTGTLNPATCKVAYEGKEMTATQFEAHAGAGTAKKWKTSLRILPGQVPECSPGVLLLPALAPFMLLADISSL